MQGNRASLAKAITLIESSRSDHQHQADLLLGYLAKQCKNSSTRFQHGKTLRLGFAGPPGGKLLLLQLWRYNFTTPLINRCGYNVTPCVSHFSVVVICTGGKSSLIEKIGMQYINQGLKVAVIPVDPSSHRSGGSILGDKTRMEELSCSTSAYVRASPTKCFLGGIAQHTVDVMSLCEYANYDGMYFISMNVR